MVIKVSQEQIDLLTRRESERYIKQLYDVIIKTSPSTNINNDLMDRLKDAEQFITRHGFNNKKIKIDFLIVSAFEPGFYKTKAMENWLLNGSESAENEYVKYLQIRDNLMNRMNGGINE